MSHFEVKQDFEIIDNEKNIKEKLGNLDRNSEDFVKRMDALFKLDKYDNLVKNYDLDLVQKKETDEFYFSCGGEILNIPFNLSNIDYFGEALVQILNNENELGIAGKKDFRKIYEVPWFGGAANGDKVFYLGTKFDGNTLDLNQAIFNNNIVEELFVFNQKVKNIPESDWVIDNQIGTPDNLGFGKTDIIQTT